MQFALVAHLKMVVALSLDACGNPAYLHMKLVSDMKNQTLTDFAYRNLSKGSTISSDGFRSYAAITGFDHMQQNFTPSSDHLKGLHKIFSNLKTFLLGTYHGRCTNTQDYMNEFNFRFNRRAFKDRLFSRLIRATALSSALLC